MHKPHSEHNLVCAIHFHANTGRKHETQQVRVCENRKTLHFCAVRSSKQNRWTKMHFPTNQLYAPRITALYFRTNHIPRQSGIINLHVMDQQRHMKLVFETHKNASPKYMPNTNFLQKEWSDKLHAFAVLDCIYLSAQYTTDWTNAEASLTAP